MCWLTYIINETRLDPLWYNAQSVWKSPNSHFCFSFSNSRSFATLSTVIFFVNWFKVMPSLHSLLLILSSSNLFWKYYSSYLFWKYTCKRKNRIFFFFFHAWSFKKFALMSLTFHFWYFFFHLLRNTFIEGKYNCLIKHNFL